MYSSGTQLSLSNASDFTEANMFTKYHPSAKRYATALMLTLIGAVPALANPMWSSAAPVQYLQYGLARYFDLMTSSTSTYWRPSSGVESSYSGLFDYAPGVIVRALPMAGSTSPYTAYVPYLGYDLTPYYNLAPGCPLSNPSDDLIHIC